MVKGYSYTPTYRSWATMRTRCLSPLHNYFHLYGGRGIKICKRWLDSYQNFLDDMGERPEGKTLDRINPDGNYEPSNCRWASIEQQNVNTRMRKDNSSGYIGVVKRPSGKWVANMRIGGKKIYLGTFDEALDAAYMRDQFVYQIHGKSARFNVLWQ